MTPEKMVVLSNVKMMKEEIGENVEYYELEKYSIEELREMQDKLIPIYNKTVRSSQTVGKNL